MFGDAPYGPVNRSRAKANATTQPGYYFSSSGWRGKALFSTLFTLAISATAFPTFSLIFIPIYNNAMAGMAGSEAWEVGGFTRDGASQEFGVSVHIMLIRDCRLRAGCVRVKKRKAQKHKWQLVRTHF